MTGPSSHNSVAHRAGSNFLRSPAVGQALRFVVVLATVAAITLLGTRFVPVNATTAGFVYLLAILAIATGWGFVEAATASVTASLCLNFFFLPPVGTFTIAEPENWVALLSFLLTSITVSQLSTRAKRRTQEALDRRQEMERLYALSRAILLIDPSQDVGRQMANHIARIFDLRAVVLLDRLTREIIRAGPEDVPEIEDRLREAALQGTSFHDPLQQTTLTAIRLGGEPIGSLAICGALLSDAAMQALSNLVAIGLEKVRAQEAASRAEAARQSEELKSTLLDAIAHDLKTPLTSIKAATTALLSEAIAPPAQRELLVIADEEADHLARLVSEAIQTARLEAGSIQLARELQSIPPLVSSVLEEMRPATEGRPVAVKLAEPLPVVALDPDLIKLALRQLLDNALKYSPPCSPVEITAETTKDNLVISVSDRGPGIPQHEQPRIFEKFYRLQTHRERIPGTGVGLAIARRIAEAHQGSITVAGRPGGGSVFALSIPLESGKVTL